MTYWHLRLWQGSVKKLKNAVLKKFASRVSGGWVIGANHLSPIPQHAKVSENRIVHEKMVSKEANWWTFPINQMRSI